MRLFLLEKGRNEGVSACNGGQRHELHGECNYTISTSGGDIKLLKVVGASRWTTSKGTITEINSKMESEKRKLEGLNFAMAEPHSDEVKGQLAVSIAAAETKVKALVDRLESFVDTPKPVTTIRYFKV